MAGNGTRHHQLHGFAGWGLIIGLPITIAGVVMALRAGTSDAPAMGLAAWLTNPIMAIGFSIFFTFAALYCKLEMDEVINDYFSGGLRSFGLLINKLVALILWVLVVYAVVKLAFLG